ncbi:hypothetical protein EDB19DRAFT_692465 [Suillus lakei]|nr:hypothetical protein EDB19DRAFT_692465 [Suillus lakei]
MHSFIELHALASVVCFAFYLCNTNHQVTKTLFFELTKNLQYKRSLPLLSAQLAFCIISIESKVYHIDTLRYCQRRVPPMVY